MSVARIESNIQTAIPVAKERGIQYSITQPIGPFERLICYLVGDGMGAVHQYVTMMMYLNNQAALDKLLTAPGVQDGSGRITMRQLCAGVIWNDFPFQTKELAKTGRINTLRYSAALDEIDKADAPYLKHEDFRVQPRRSLRYAVAAMYKKFPPLLTMMCGVTAREIAEAKDLLDFRTREDKTHYHFMRESAADTTQMVCERAAKQGREWMLTAVKERDIFWVGCILHMMEDRSSPAHCHSHDSMLGLKWGAVAFVEWFGDQNDNSHGYLESYNATADPERPTKRRVELFTSPNGPLFSVVRLFLEGIAANTDPIKVADDTYELLSKHVFNYRPDLQCDLGLFCEGHEEGQRALQTPAEGRAALQNPAEEERRTAVEEEEQEEEEGEWQLVPARAEVPEAVKVDMPWSVVVRVPTAPGEPAKWRCEMWKPRTDRAVPLLEDAPAKEFVAGREEPTMMLPTFQDVDAELGPEVERPSPFLLHRVDWSLCDWLIKPRLSKMQGVPQTINK